VFIIACILFYANKILKDNEQDLEKLSSYECGFDPYGSLGHNFDIHFYVIALSFIIFDLEIIFLYPWAVTLSEITLVGFFCLVYFLYNLTIIFIYEWRSGSLDWNLSYIKE
jgi:NADH-quinone oxidoreductase subunit A